MEGGGGDNLAFDAGSKAAKIPKSHYGGGGGVPGQHFMWSPNLLKT